jgi:hypothetical protein
MKHAVHVTENCWEKIFSTPDIKVARLIVVATDIAV